MTLKQIVEALVFASPKPLSTKEIVAALKSAGNPDKTDDAAALEFAKTKEDDLFPVLAEIQAELEATGRAFQLVEQVNGWSFVTIPSAVHWVRQLYPEAKPTRLTGPQLETLAIIAYRQPVTRADIEAVRGVAVDSVVQVLMERSLIKIAGRADVPGRPLLYQTTEYFLQHFGLKTVHELPNAVELRRIELPKAEHPESEAPKEKPKKAKKGEETAAAEPVKDNSADAPDGSIAEVSEAAEAIEAPEASEASDASETAEEATLEVDASAPVEEAAPDVVEEAVEAAPVIEHSTEEVAEVFSEPEVSELGDQPSEVTDAPEASEPHAPQQPPTPDSTEHSS